MGPQRFDGLRLARDLPSPPLGLKILELTRDEDFEQAEFVVRCAAIPRSPRVLRLANGAVATEPVADVHQAAMAGLQGRP